jgi:hypothetical protein
MAMFLFQFFGAIEIVVGLLQGWSIVYQKRRKSHHIVELDFQEHLVMAVKNCRRNGNH